MYFLLSFFFFLEVTLDIDGKKAYMFLFFQLVQQYYWQLINVHSPWFDVDSFCYTKTPQQYISKFYLQLS